MVDDTRGSVDAGVKVTSVVESLEARAPTTTRDHRVNEGPIDRHESYKELQGYY